MEQPQLLKKHETDSKMYIFISKLWRSMLWKKTANCQ